jgi:Subtilase family
MGSRRLSRWLVAATVPAAMAMAAVPAGAAAAAAHSGTARAPQHQYIVILRDQNRRLGARTAARRAAVRAEQAPVQAEIRSLGARNVGSTSLVNAVVADMTATEAQSLAANPGVAQVIPNGVIQGPVRPNAPAGTGTGSGAAPASSAQLCGTASAPQLNPEALSVINSVQANQMGYDGAGVGVALLADGLNPADPDFQRNPAFASSGSPAGAPVVTQADFSGDGVNAPTAGGEAFLDASSIAAQGNTAYDLSQYVSTAHPLPAGCDIKIEGVAPGASVLALKVFAQNDDTTTSGFLQAINYAVAQGVKVINESFGGNDFPDLTADAIRQADDAAVAAGVTVVVSTGDGGITSTIGSPATDPDVISVGATTTFRGYAQDTDGGINYPGWNGRYVDNNISSLSSGGVSQAGGTVDLVAPGDLNWALCDTDITLYSDCTNENGAGSPIQLSGGTSESSPLTAGAAADVIQAYASSHGGADPSPALVKQILMSTATDTGAPATQQGAGLLNVAAAVRLARSAGSGQATSGGGLLVSPGQVTVTQNPGATTARAISVTNTGSSPVSVALSTRALTDQVGDQAGSFCMQPGTPTAACPANTGSFPIWSGVTEVYQAEHFTVPHTSGTSRLSFSADYPYTGQTSLLHFALFEPDGTYAAYSLPQGLGDYGNVQVTDPPAGKWTAVFFTEQDGATAGGIGTSGTVQWDASTSQYAPAGSISPATLSLGPGQTRSAGLSLTSPQAAGDTSQSVVISAGQSQTTVPVVVRTQIPVGAGGGTFSGVLTGGNGRADTQAQGNTYVFSVPRGETDLDASVALANDPGDEVIGYLVDPDGQTVGYSSNVTTDSSGSLTSTRFMNLYHVAPEPGQWTLDLAWQNPVTGSELQEPFTGAIRFNQVQVSSNLPRNGHLAGGKAATYAVTVHNTGLAPEAFFADPRLNQSATVNLADQNGSETNMSLPLAAGLTFPYYFVPSHTSQLQASLTGTVPVNFDVEYFPGDPDLSGVQSGDSASLTVTEPEVSPGMWLINPDEIGPYPATGAPAATATASLSAVTQAFDPAVTSSTGDFWSIFNGLSSASFDPVYVPAGGKGTITVSITPTAASGTQVSGTLYVSDFTLGSFFFGGPALGDADDLAAIPYSYRVTG